LRFKSIDNGHQAGQSTKDHLHGTEMRYLSIAPAQRKLQVALFKGEKGKGEICIMYVNGNMVSRRSKGAKRLIIKRRLMSDPELRFHKFGGCVGQPDPQILVCQREGLATTPRAGTPPKTRSGKWDARSVRNAV